MLQRRTPLRSMTALHRRTPLQPIGRRGRARKRAQALMTAEVIERDGEGCVLGRVEAAGECFGPMGTHHLVKAWRGAFTDVAANGVRLCNGHNGWVEDHPDEARALGLVEREIPPATRCIP